MARYPATPAQPAAEPPFMVESLRRRSREQDRAKFWCRCLPPAFRRWWSGGSRGRRHDRLAVGGDPGQRHPSAVRHVGVAGRDPL